MKKLKFLLPLILALAMALTIPFAAACKKDDKKGGDEPGGENPPLVVATEVLSISLNTDDVKTEFYTGEAFNASNLVVNAVVKKSDKTETETVNVSTLAKVNSAAYNRNKMGTYSIKVSYEGKTASYNVNVTKADLVWEPGSSFKDLYLVNENLVDLKTNGKFYLETQRPGDESVTKTEVTNGVSIDSSAFDNKKEAQYAINATYNMPALASGFTVGYPVEKSIYVNVIESREGLNVTLAAGVEQTIPLSGTMATATIDSSKIVVKRVDDYGAVVDTPLAASDYTVELWKEDIKVTPPASGSVYTGLTGGVYQIWASANSLKGNTDYKLSGFAVIVVADEVTGISVNQNGHTSQDAGLDYLSSQWTYTVSYISGASKTVTKDEVEFYTFNTKVVGANKTATVKYSEQAADGTKKTVQCTVNYTINASSLSTLPTETFIVKNVADAATRFETVTPVDSDGVGGVVTDNALFTITTEGEMKWAEANGSATSANSKWITNVTLLDNTVVDKFDAGLSQSAVTNPEEETPGLIFTAKTDITLKAYLTLCNAPYNSNRKGTLTATITHKDGSVTVREIDKVGEARETKSDLTFDLYEGDVLVITIRNDAQSAATMWLFGAEATGYKAVSNVEGN